MISFERELSTAWMDAHYPSPSEPEQLPEPVQVAQAGGAAFGVFPAMKSKASRTGEISEVAKMAPADIAAGAGKGLITGGVGTPGDLESLIRGVRSIFTRTGDVTKVDAFLSGLEEQTILPTSSDVSRWLDENIGPVVPPAAPMASERAGLAGAGQFAGELVSGPGTLVKGGKAAAKTAAATGKFVKPKVGEMLDAYMRRSGMQLELTAYHGTPHRFPPEEGAPLGRFRSEKIGTGEGAQAFGHGLYFAESPDVARGYRNVLADTLAVSGDATTLEKRAGQMALTFGDGTKEGAIRWLGKFEGKGASHTAPALTPELIKSVKAKFEAGTFKQGGSLYTVDIPDEMVGKMLDWDKPLGQQAPEVREAIKAASESPMLRHLSKSIFSDDVNVRGLLDRLSLAWRRDYGSGGEPQVVEVLRQAGIPGIRYLDAGSRGGADGTRNIVVFPGGENQIKIIKAE